MKRIFLALTMFTILLIAGCTPSDMVQSPGVSEPLADTASQPVAAEGSSSETGGDPLATTAIEEAPQSQIASGSPLITATGEAPQAAATSASHLPVIAGGAQAPAGWATYTSQQCDYAISFPPEFEVTEQTPYSQTFAVKSPSPDAGARNFVYVSVITPDIAEMVTAGAYDSSVYNYDPLATEVLLNMQVAESKSVHPAAEVAPSFTYLRRPDADLGGYPAQAYENLQPWEFPVGTKEIRYYAPAGECVYLIGGYMDTAGTAQAGAISEDLFNQVIATIMLMP